MAMHDKLTQLFLFGACSLGIACGASKAANDDGVTAAALDETNGGLTPSTAEAPAFGDAEVEAIPLMDSTLAAAAEPTDLTTTAAAVPGASAYRVALVWGHLPPAHDADSTDLEPVAVDWTGSVSVDAGAVGLKRTIAFDPLDHVDPRTDPLTLSFTSHTLPYVDGLLLRVVIPSGGAPTLHFATVGLTTDIDLSQLAAGVGGVQRLADGVEGLAYIGFPEDGCTRGFFHGRWVKKAPALGRVLGVVSDADGNRVGHLRGLWGHAAKRDADVWFAKYIGADGSARGLSFGHYGEGTFDGMWGATDESNAVGSGTAEGFYSDGYDVGDGRGVWLGRWSEQCAAN